jgi:hypothetical protein
MRNNLLRAILVVLAGAYAVVAHAADPGTRVAAQALQIGSGIGLLTTSGYETTGDLGAAHYKRDTSLTACGFQSADGAFWTLAEPILNPIMCGAKGDWNGTTGTNDRVALQALLDACFGCVIDPLNKRYLIGATSGTEILLWKYPGHIRGRGMSDTGGGPGSVLVVKSDTPTTIDVIRLAPDASITGESLFGWELSDLRIKAASGTPARDGFVIDLPDTAAAFIAKFKMSGVFIGPFNRRAFTMRKGTEGGTPVNTNGFFTSLVAGSRFDGGPAADRVISLDNSGDSLKFSDVTVTGTGIGVYSRPVSGAVQQVFEDVNSTASGGALYLKNAGQAKIRGGQFEQLVAYTGADDALIVLDGCVDCEIDGSNLNTHNLVSAINFKGAASRNRMHDATIRVTASKFHFVIGASTSYNDIGAERNTLLTDEVQVLAPLVSDASSATQYGVWRALPLSNSWVAASSGGFTDGLYARVTPDGIVRLKGWLTGGTNTSGITIATLPAGMRPLGTENKRITVKFLDTTWKTTELAVLLNGSIQIPVQLFTAVSLVGFDSVSFTTY